MKYSATALAEMIKQAEAVKRGEMRFLDIIMPNGKRLADCNGTEVGEVGKALALIGEVFALLDV
jgi:hypothetical protein